MENKITAYVDGSFNVETHTYAYGCVIIKPDDETITLSGSDNNPEVAIIRNVAGEMLGAMNAVKWAKKEGYSEIEICYDYSGIEMWATGKWKAKNKYTKGYADYMRTSAEKIKITYTKVEAHTGVKYNEMADRLARAALDK